MVLIQGRQSHRVSMVVKRLQTDGLGVITFQLLLLLLSCLLVVFVLLQGQGDGVVAIDCFLLFRAACLRCCRRCCYRRQVSLTFGALDRRKKAPVVVVGALVAGESMDFFHIVWVMATGVHL